MRTETAFILVATLPDTIRRTLALGIATAIRDAQHISGARTPFSDIEASVRQAGTGLLQGRLIEAIVLALSITGHTAPIHTMSDEIETQIEEALK